VLGAAGTIQIFANFPQANGPAPGTTRPGEPQAEPTSRPARRILACWPHLNDDIVAYFNGDIGVNPDCLTGFSWYNGLDNNAGPNDFDLLNVVLHEFSHGLGFANFVDDATGSAILGLADVYSAYSYDNEQGLFWNQMDKRERAASAVNAPELVWKGPHVFAEAPNQLAGIPVVRVNSPAGIAGDYEAQAASYGCRSRLPVTTGDVVLYDDGTGRTERRVRRPRFERRRKDRSDQPRYLRVCAQVRAGQLSGAVGVIIANNQPTGLHPIGGSDLIPPTISSVGISRADGNLLKANLPLVNATLVADPALGLAGADADGFPKLYAPSPVQPGSSVSHWDITLTPNKLMEPFISSDLKGATTLDLTPFLMTDIGWSGGPHCPAGADDRASVMVGSCSTRVSNSKGPYGFSLGIPRTIPELPAPLNGNAYGVDVFGGCYIQDMVNGCRNQGDLGQVRSCLEHVTKYLGAIGEITPTEGQAILRCAR
jgi:hypothetical protein